MPCDEHKFTTHFMHASLNYRFNYKKIQRHPVQKQRKRPATFNVHPLLYIRVGLSYAPQVSFLGIHHPLPKNSIYDGEERFSSEDLELADAVSDAARWADDDEA